MKSWYRLRRQAWSVQRLEREVTKIASVVLEEHRIPEVILLVPAAGDPRFTYEDLLVALALHSARLVPDGPGAPVLRSSRAESTAALIALAADVLIKAGPKLNPGGIDRLRRYHRWLSDLAATWTSDAVTIPRINDNERRLAGFLTGLGARDEVPEPGFPGDPSGSWAEGVIDALIHGDKFGLCTRFVAREVLSSQFGRLDRTVLNAKEYMAERLAVRILAGPAMAAGTKHARELGLTLARELRELEVGYGIPPLPSELTRRARAVRHYLLGDWHEARTQAVLSGPILVRTELEREYGFALLAAIAHEAVSKLRDEREPHTAAFLHAEVARGRGPFLDAPIREMGEELPGRPSISELAAQVVNLVPHENAEALDAAVWELVIARTFNVTHSSYSPHELLALAAQLRERSAKIEGAATQLELLGSDAGPPA